MKNIILFLVIIIPCIFVYYFFISDSRDERLIKEASILIEKIEEYKKVNGVLPLSLEKAGLTSPTHGVDELFYTLGKDSLVYMITYGDGLGESKAYYSDTKEWGRFVGRLP